MVTLLSAFDPFALELAEWFRLRSWYRETGRDSRELQKDEKRQLAKQSCDQTFTELVDSYLIACKTKYK
ncbi:Hypothetical protein P9303_20341 [Prochlorococcus marinus str. MIT 9303]|uniref:Uncharacterized protein n=1 Tax=Prochlorococcus marinus (strain MIT 9303) TaxID=59922 RepID=A2CBB4_PROM3|nr:Hypothetical protein P9303_20341 [Prochlorococcus marinus str. MIT 9303]